MNKRLPGAALLFCLFLLASSLYGDTAAVKNSGFEQAGDKNLPLNWSAVQPADGADVECTAAHAHTGQQALRISHSSWNQSYVESDDIDLHTGHLYRLSFWVKTAGAVSYPTDRYPTSVPVAATMASFPFTNHSPAAGATKDWQKIETLFFATKSKDRIRLHLGLNGSAKGNVWFDDVSLQEVEDISEYIPSETVTWCDKGFRYDDRGWIFVHIEGTPYKRGFQYGYLVADEMTEYINKLGIQQYEEHPSRGWSGMRFQADALMLRKYDPEYLEEMQGIADGANRAGASIFGRDLDLVDIVTLNSSIDLGQARGGISREGHALSGKSFLAAEDELDIPCRQHKCSGFLANKSATKSGGIVFGQIFMWSGYTGPHWNVILDVVPSSGNRLVYETYPGGIHSGADFYINSKGIMIGETTVSQTPFDAAGTPQSNRIRKAAQYAGSIDDVVKILSKHNNGMYTNDWLIGDAKTDEIAIFLLGTRKSKLWRSSKKDFPGGLTDFYWSNNNNKDLEVRKEYIYNSNNAPYDLAFSPWNRDVQFVNFYRKNKGNIDQVAGVNLWASSPINRPHACDGKITTSEMAKNLMFLAHSGKVTLREKFIGENHRIPDLPGAVPRLSLGYSIVSPVFVADKIIAAAKEKNGWAGPADPPYDFSGVQEPLSWDRHYMWHNTVFPASCGENWFVSSTAAMWRTLHYLPESSRKAFTQLHNTFTDLNCRLLYVQNREGTVKPVDAKQVYDRYNNYQIPRIRGCFLLHQMRLFMGNENFGGMMKTIHNRFAEKEMANRDFISIAEKAGGNLAKTLYEQWITRDDLPEPSVQARVEDKNGSWDVVLSVSQDENPYVFATTVTVNTGKKNVVFLVKITEAHQDLVLNVPDKPVSVTFNSMNDIPVKRDAIYTMSSFYDDWHNTVIVYGTSRQIEANHTLALRYSKVLADRYSETLVPVIKDCEISPEKCASSDLILLGGPEDNTIVRQAAEKLGLSIGKNTFTFQNTTYGDADDGLFVALPSPYNHEKIVYLFVANSALQLYHMTNEYHRMPAWALFKGGRIYSKGYHTVDKYTISL